MHILIADYLDTIVYPLRILARMKYNEQVCAAPKAEKV